MPTRTYVDGSWTTAVAITQPLYTCPFEGVNVQYLLEQQFVIFAENFSPLALNTPHPDDATFILVSESPLEDFGNGAVKWTRIYAKLPSQRIEASSYGYDFIGYLGQIFSAGMLATTDLSDFVVANYLGRARKLEVVPAKLQFDYYLLDGVTLIDSGDVPLIQRTVYLGEDNSTEMDFIWNGPPAYDSASTPSRTDYEAMIAADLPVAEGGTNSFSLVAEASRLTRWKGNIFERATLYIKAR